MWGELVRDLRIEKGFSQRLLAKEAGINRSTLRRIESGGSEILIPAMEATLSVLGYELDAIKVRDVKRRDPHKTKKSLICIRLPREV